jgi:hypothetical protein
MIIEKKSKDFCFRYLIFVVNQKREILFAQDILFALDKPIKLRTGHYINKYLEKVPHNPM